MDRIKNYSDAVSISKKDKNIFLLTHMFSSEWCAMKIPSEMDLKKLKEHISYILMISSRISAETEINVRQMAKILSEVFKIKCSKTFTKDNTYNSEDTAVIDYYLLKKKNNDYTFREQDYTCFEKTIRTIIENLIFSGKQWYE